ncbi:MAG: pitrilysin family protein [Gemmatimonadetes bacterium]|nr:pitrilysin family protein [Gemmatimonadota bacterium]
MMWTAIEGRNFGRVLAAFVLLALTACGTEQDGSTGVSIDYERYELANGLDVILHIDRSDPIAAVAMTFHVGSAREVQGKTGFAHLFEHLFFLDSENLGPGGLDRLMTRVGSSTNGSTSRDRTNYFEVVPTDGLEKTLWAEADKLGYFINTVTEQVVAKEKQVVKNEKRQSVDNQPYGHTSYVLDQAMYPEGHPYRWQVIGSLEDLENARLADVRAFHQRWYGPNNATLVVAGDLDFEQTKAWIEHYFGGIPPVDMPEVPEAPPVQLAESIRLFHEDNLARLPMLTIAWPTVPMYHPDAYALDILADLLTDAKTAPFYEVIVKEKELAPAVGAGNGSQELAGRFSLQVRAYPGVDLDSVEIAVTAAFARFEAQGVFADELERVKAGYETGFYSGLSSVIGKAFQLAQYNLFANDPGYAAEDLRGLLGVTSEDVMRVHAQYIQGKASVTTSFVPRGAVELALVGSTQAEVVEEPIVAGAEAAVVVDDRGDIPLTPSTFNRTVEPPYGASPSLSAPSVWVEANGTNAVRVFGIEDREVPLVQFQLRFSGGQLREEAGRVGIANLLAETMTEGTANKTPEELEKAIDMLGASINVSSGSTSFSISGNTLARNYAVTMDLVREILLEPRFDAEEFDLAKQRVASTLQQRAASPTAIAGSVFSRLLYGDHILAENGLGSAETIDAFTLDDLRAYHANALMGNPAVLHVVGAVDQAAVMASVGPISLGIGQQTSAFEAIAPAWDAARAGLYFVDVPNAGQSVLSVGYLALREPDDDFYPATVMNFRLGGGGFASDLTQVLREQRGYTYGIRSGFSGSEYVGPFQVSSSVRANVTLEALELIKGIVEAHGPGFDDADLEATKSFLLRANARAFETAGAKLGLLGDMSLYGFPADYVIRREQIVRDMTVDRVKELAGEYLGPAGMIWLVVGDARTQMPRLRALGLGDPVMLDRNGLPVR